MREQIVSEIRRIAATNGGKAPGRAVFERLTGIRESAWRGIHWARWGDALAEAGVQQNELQGRLDEQFFLTKLAEAFRHFDRIPTTAELRLYGRTDPTFPAHSTIDNWFAGKAEMLDRLAEWSSGRPEYADVAGLLADRPQSQHRPERDEQVAEGLVYLIRSGAHYKIGRSDEIERRMKEIRIALPEAATLVHTIRTDDPPGIEAYWHRRFADRRANGEWFRLSAADVATFKRRKYQ